MPLYKSLQEMRISIFLPFLLVITSCTMTPPLKVYLVGDGVFQYFLSPTNWTAQNTKAQLDITYRTKTDTPATVNISFFGNRNTPQTVSSVSLHGREIDYPLENISVILVKPDRNELRITSTGDRDELIYLLNNEPITLKAEVDGIIYIYTPEKGFITLKNRFLAAILF
jgi:hypothetical protein